MKLNPLFILSITLTIFSCNAPRIYHSKLRGAWPKKGYIPGCFVGNGVVYLKSGSNVAGLILTCPISNDDDKLDSSRSSIQILPIGRTKTQDIQDIYYKDITNIKIQYTGNIDSVEFKPFGGALANLLGKK